MMLTYYDDDHMADYLFVCLALIVMILRVMIIGMISTIINELVVLLSNIIYICLHIYLLLLLLNVLYF